jgi:hypothetical protein
MVQQELSLADQFSKLKVNVAKFSLALCIARTIGDEHP